MDEKKMMGAVLPGNSTVELHEYEIPTPGHGEVLIKMKSSTICGSDIRAIYHEHLGKGPEGYQGVIAGHEPCGQIVAEGPGLRRFKTGDRIVIYHISVVQAMNTAKPMDGSVMVEWQNIFWPRKKILCCYRMNFPIPMELRLPADLVLCTKVWRRLGYLETILFL